tara:strand:- start:42602 stop:42937 length:336 start_codon:yes stop_codon:yes gene_type:complete
MFSTETYFEILKTIASCSIFFVWFVRYDNIKKEFKEYGFPTWFRDFVGILKISSIAMLHSGNINIVKTGAATISVLMLGAVLTHIFLKDTFRNTIASVSMLIISITMISMI